MEDNEYLLVTGHPVTRQIHVPLPLDETFELISNLDQRLLWNRGIDELRFDPNRVNSAGTRHQCVIDGDLIEFETVTGDFGPDKLVAVLFRWKFGRQLAKALKAIAEEGRGPATRKKPLR